MRHDDAYFNSPDALKSSFGAGALFSSTSRLMWPHEDLFDEEHRDREATAVSMVTTPVVRDRNGSEDEMHNTSARRYIHRKNAVSQSSDIFSWLGRDRQSWMPRSWWTGKIGRSYVGVCCTAATNATGTGVMKHGFKKTRTSPELHFRMRRCAEPEHAWICVVGTEDEFPRLHDFRMHCEEVKIVEYWECARRHVSGDEATATSWFGLHASSQGNEFTNDVYVVEVIDPRQRKVTVDVDTRDL